MCMGMVTDDPLWLPGSLLGGQLMLGHPTTGLRARHNAKPGLEGTVGMQVRVTSKLCSLSVSISSLLEFLLCGYCKVLLPPFFLGL